MIPIFYEVGFTTMVPRSHAEPLGVQPTKRQGGWPETIGFWERGTDWPV